ncbi:MAG: hypothetical protein H6Q16_2059 [Bacteroidetes bacterium]|nr:hypothetical protein [Bacteroidota bacterium]
MINALFSSLPLWVCVFWFLTLFLNFNSNTLAKKFLILFFFIATINYFTHFLYFNNQYNIYCFAENIWIFTSLSLFPIYYYYIRLLTIDSKTSFALIWLFVPSILFSLFSFVLYFLMDSSEKNIYTYNILYGNNRNLLEYNFILRLQLIKINIFRIVLVTQVLIFIVTGIKHISSYHNSIKEFYSDTKNKELKSIKYLLIILIFASIMSSLSAIVGKYIFINNQVLIIFPSLVHSLFLYGIGYIGYKQYFSITEFRDDILNADKNYSKELTQKNTNNNNLKEQLIILLEEKEIFKNPDLRISDVSTFLNTNRTYISNLVNDEFDQSFADLINNHRIKYAIKILEEKNNVNLSISEIGLMSGFLSESSFYRVFKDKVGVSPGRYRKKIFDKTKNNDD